MSTAEPGVSGPSIRGECFGVSFEKREKHDPLFHIWIEDDEIWHRKDVRADIYWLNDLIDVLTRACNTMRLDRGETNE